MITGTSRGLGAELARLAHDRFGAAVLGIDRSEPSHVGMYEHVRADLATAEGRERAVVALHEWKPTVLVNCAMTNQSKRVVDTSPALTDEIIGVGFTTPFTLMREMALSRSQSDDDAWVINIVSPYRLVGVRTHSLYCAVKAALSRAGFHLLWLSHWQTRTPLVPGDDWAGQGWTFWQWTEQGTVPGIAGFVDRDVYSGPRLDQITIAVVRADASGDDGKPDRPPRPRPH